MLSSWLLGVEFARPLTCLRPACKIPSHFIQRRRRANHACEPAIYFHFDHAISGEHSLPRGCARTVRADGFGGTLDRGPGGSRAAEDPDRSVRPIDRRPPGTFCNRSKFFLSLTPGCYEVIGLRPWCSNCSLSGHAE